MSTKPKPAPRARSASRRFRTALKWSFVMNWGSQGFTLFITFLMAMLLGPDEFGAVAMAGVYIMFIEIFFDQGLNAAIVQRKKIEREHLDSAFWLILGASLVLTVLSVLLSGWWARVNNVPILEDMIDVLSLTIPLRGFTIVQQAVLMREMDFRVLAIRANASVVLGGVLGLGMAVAGYGVWALVAQQVLTALAALVLLWTLAHWRPSFRFSARHARELLGFSSMVLVGKIGLFVEKRMGVLLTGLFFGPIPVGLYRLADRAVSTLMEALAGPVGLAAFSAFSRSQDDSRELQHRFQRCVQATAAAVLPAMVCTAVLAEPLVRLLGERWKDAAVALKVLAFAGALRALTVFLGPLLHASSKPHLVAAVIWTFALFNALGVMTVGTLLGTSAPVKSQVLGICLVQVSMVVLFFPLNLYFSLRYGGLSLRAFLRAIGPAVAASLAGVAVGTGLAPLLSSVLHAPILQLLILGPVVACVCLVTLLALDGQLRRDVQGFLGLLKAAAHRALRERVSEEVAR